ncbi:MAG: hypothetical protein ABEI78_02485, partial [Candidatus Nanohaloarchaea archaeon]
NFLIYVAVLVLLLCLAGYAYFKGYRLIPLLFLASTLYLIGVKQGLPLPFPSLNSGYGSVVTTFAGFFVFAGLLKLRAGRKDKRKRSYATWAAVLVLFVTITYFLLFVLAVEKNPTTSFLSTIPSLYSDYSVTFANLFNLVTLGAYKELLSLSSTYGGSSGSLIFALSALSLVAAFSLKLALSYGLISIVFGNTIDSILGAKSSFYAILAVSLIVSLGVTYVTTGAISPSESRIGERLSDASGILSSGESASADVYTRHISDTVGSFVEAYKVNSGNPYKLFGLNITKLISYIIGAVGIVLVPLMFKLYVVTMLPKNLTDLGWSYLAFSIGFLILGVAGINTEIMVAVSLTFFTLFISRLSVRAVGDNIHSDNRTKFFKRVVYSLTIAALVSVWSSILPLPVPILSVSLVSIITLVIYSIVLFIGFVLHKTYRFKTIYSLGGILRHPSDDKPEVIYYNFALLATVLTLVGVFLYGALIGVLWMAGMLLSITGIVDRFKAFKTFKKAQTKLPKDATEELL